MEREWDARETAEGGIDPESRSAIEGGPEEPGVRTSPTWRGLVIAVIAAIVLSVTATLLLGGSFGVYDRRAAGGCGSGGDCCPLPVDK